MRFVLTSNAELRLVVAGEAFANLGDQLMLLAVPTVALLTLHLSPSKVSLLTTAQWLPALFLSVFAGRLVDRANRASVLVLAAVMSGLSAGTVAYTSQASRFQFETLFVACFIYAFAGLLTSLASTALLPTLVERSNADGGYAARAAGRSTARVVGQAIAGPIVQFLGAVSGLLFVIVISAFRILFALRVGVGGRRRGPQPDVKTTLEHEVSEQAFSPWTTVWQNTPTRKIVLGNFVINSGGSVILGIFFAYAYQILFLSPFSVGVMLFLGGSAAIYSARKAASIMKSTHGRLISVACGIIAALSVWLIPLAMHLAPLIVLSIYEVVFSSGATVFGVGLLVIAQQMVPNSLLGRLMSVLTTLNAGAIVLGTSCAFLLADRIGVVTVLVAGCTISSCGATYLATYVWSTYRPNANSPASSIKQQT